jgi:thiaminase/transcriptional activator TenA
MRFTDVLRKSAGSQWDRVVNHKFTDELAEGTLDKDVLKRYLVQDHRFLDAFVVLLSTIISKARTLSDRIPGCQFLALITGKF